MSSKLRILHVGCGGVSKGWVTAATQNPAVEVAGLVDLNEEAARKRVTESKSKPKKIGETS